MIIRSRGKRVVATAVAAIAATAGLGLAAAPAAQAVPGASVTAASVPAARSAVVQPRTADFTGTGVRIHSDDYTGSPTVGEGNKGDGLNYLGATEGEYISVCGSDIWVHVTDRRTGVTGWVTSCYVWV